jgi:xylulose-5-phosphate/fructose-6-phosphate phosphoketolase
MSGAIRPSSHGSTPGCAVTIPKRCSTDVHPHGMDDDRFVSLFTADRPIVFAFHGYQRAIHEIVHGRPQAWRFHVRGFNEQGTTTTPFTMVAMNEMSRYHLAMEGIRRVPRLKDWAPDLIADCRRELAEALAYAHDHLEDDPAISQWVWPA